MSFEASRRDQPKRPRGGRKLWQYKKTNSNSNTCDIGLFAPLMLNTVELRAGWSDVPIRRNLHAYVQGTGWRSWANCIMLRAGLTQNTDSWAFIIGQHDLEPFCCRRYSSWFRIERGQDELPDSGGWLWLWYSSGDWWEQVTAWRSAEILFCVVKVPSLQKDGQFLFKPGESGPAVIQVLPISREMGFWLVLWISAPKVSDQQKRTRWKCHCKSGTQ